MNFQFHKKFTFMPFRGLEKCYSPSYAITSMKALEKPLPVDSCRRTVTDVKTMIIKDLNSNSSTSWGLLSIHSFFLLFLENSSTVCSTALHQFWLQSLVTRSQLDICCFSTTSNHVLTKGIVCSSYKFFTVRSPLSHTGSHQVLLLASRPSSLWCSSAHT